MSLQVVVHPPIVVDAAVTKQKLVVVAEEEEEEEDAKSSGCPSAGSQPSSSDQEDRDEDVRKTKNGCFSSFRSLEDSLPLKRGLSNYFSGKSRSFHNLSECGSGNVEELAKPENPFNKRQRILTSLSRRASCSSIATATPSLFSHQHAVEEEEDEFEGTERGPVPSLRLRRKTRNNNEVAFRPTSSFSDLQSV